MTPMPASDTATASAWLATQVRPNMNDLKTLTAQIEHLCYTEAL